MVTVSDTTITKAQLIKRGDAICRKTDDIQQAGLRAYEKEHPGSIGGQAAIAAVIKEAALPPVRREIKQLAALGAPKRDRAKMVAIIEGLETALRIAERKPLSVYKFEGAFRAPGKLAADYGFEDCARPL